MFERFAKVSLNSLRRGCEQLKEFVHRQELDKMEKGDAARNTIDTEAQLRAYNARMRRQYIDAIGGIPAPSVALDARVTGVHQLEGYRIENIRFCPREGVWASAALYIPDGIRLPAPGILFLCGHSENGYRYPSYQIACQTLVRSGLIVFALDPTGQGERSNYYDPGTGAYRVERSTPDHSCAGLTAIPAGQALIRYFISDMIRAVDYMVTRPEIDPEKIGVTGISGGGTQAAALMMCDDRIAAAAPGCYITTLREIMLSGMAQDAEQIWPGVNAMGFDLSNPFLMMAPKPALILAANWDFFPIEGTWEVYEAAKRVYSLLGQADAMRIFTDDNPHGYSPAMAVAAASFFNEFLLGKAITVANDDITPLPESILNTTESGNILGSVPGAIPVQQEIRATAEVLRKARLALPETERMEKARQWLTEQVFRDRKPVPFFIRTLPQPACDTEGDYVALPLSWWSQKKLFSYGTMIRRCGVTEWTTPTVIAIWPEGTDRIPEYVQWIRSQCSAGKQVLVLDAPGVGKIKQDSVNFSSSPRSLYAGVHNCANYLLYGGDSMAALLVYDVLRAVEMLKKEFSIPASKISLFCDGPDGVIGVMAGFLLENTKVEQGENLLQSIEKAIVEPQTYQYDNTLSLIVPGMLQYFDYQELL